jgi:hypothetical protein
MPVHDAWAGDVHGAHDFPGTRRLLYFNQKQVQVEGGGFQFILSLRLWWGFFIYYGFCLQAA